MQTERGVFLVRQTWMRTLWMEPFENSIDEALPVIAPFIQTSAEERCREVC